MPFDNSDQGSIVIPGDATDADSRVVISENAGDPVLQNIGQDAGIVWRFGDRGGFAIAVQQTLGGAFGEWAFYVLMDSTHLHQLMTSEADADANTASIVLGDPDPTRATRTRITGNSINLGDFPDTTDITLYDGNSLSRGYGVTVGSGFSSVPYTTTEVAAYTTPTYTMKSNRSFEVRFEGLIASTVAGDRVNPRIYRGSLAGALLRNCGSIQIAAASVSQPFAVSTIFNGSSSGVYTLTLGIIRSAGTGNCTVLLDNVTVHDLGVAA